MQNLIETRNLYNNAHDALDKAGQLVVELRRVSNSILACNTEPIMISIDCDAECEITTPTDLGLLTFGTVISAGGNEYMRTGYGNSAWTNSLGYKLSHEEMFCAMLNYVNECEIIHEGN